MGSASSIDAGTGNVDLRIAANAKSGDITLYNITGNNIVVDNLIEMSL